MGVDDVPRQRKPSDCPEDWWLAWQGRGPTPDATVTGPDEMGSVASLMDGGENSQACIPEQREGNDDE